MVKKVVFRTNANNQTGIGHLYRCVELSKELERNGVECVFCVDKVSDAIRNFFPKIKINELYGDGEEFSGDKEDFSVFLKCVKNWLVEWVVLDDYRIGEEWEKSLVESGFRLCVVDDLPRRHVCDILIDQRWRGNGNETYRKLVPAKTKTLLGPKYAIVGKEFSSQKKTGSDRFQVLVSLGGGGRSCDLIDIVRPLLDLRLENVDVKVICGPMMQDAELLVAEESFKKDSVSLLFNVNDISNLIVDSDLFVGAAGGTIYQCLASGVPMVTVSFSKNQENDIKLLEDMGHFFHFNFNEIELSEVSVLVSCLLRNIDRVRKLLDNKKIGVDCNGAERICSEIIGSKAAEQNDPKSCLKTEWEEISKEYRIRKVSDADINEYLNGRNLANNRRNMNIVDPISRVDHCLWWFQNNRQKYVFASGCTELLYLWHELIEFGDKRYLVGGWFTKSNHVSLFDVIAAVDWQLQHCMRMHPGIPWLAIIKHGNDFVRSLNNYLGFEELVQEDCRVEAITSIFKVPFNQDFHFLVRDTSTVCEER